MDDDNPPAGSYTTAMNLTLTITLDAPLPAAGSQIDFTSNLLSYSASDGRHVLTESNSTLSGFAFVNQNSEIFGHLVTVKTGPLGLQDGDPTGLSEGDQLITMNTDFIDPGSAGDLASVIQCVAAPCILGDGDFDRDLAQNRINIPGTWSIVPIPAAAWLFGSALGLLGWARRGNI
ncbi:MAG: VPLPA-CTERM sorting domain-containing protein [Gammaproteobacteria bacterium]